MDNELELPQAMTTVIERSGRTFVSYMVMNEVPDTRGSANQAQCNDRQQNNLKTLLLALKDKGYRRSVRATLYRYDI